MLHERHKRKSPPEDFGAAVSSSPCPTLLGVAVGRLELCQDEGCAAAFALIVNLIKGLTDQVQSETAWAHMIERPARSHLGLIAEISQPEADTTGIGLQ